MIVLRRRRKEEAILARETPDPRILAGHLAAEGNRRVLDSLEPSLLRPLWVDIQPLPKDGLRVSGESILVANPSKEKIDGEFRRNRPGVAGEGFRRERCIWQPVRVRPLYGGGHKTEGANDGGLARRVRSINRGDRQHLLLQSRRLKRPSPDPGNLLAMSENSCSVRNERKFENRNLRSMFGVSSSHKRMLLPCYTPPMPPDPRELPDEPPPFLGTWRRVYTGVIVYLAVLIALCYAFTRAFS